MKKALIFLSIILLTFSFIMAFAFFEQCSFIIIGVTSIVGIIAALILLQIELQKEERDRKDRYLK